MKGLPRLLGKMKKSAAVSLNELIEFNHNNGRKLGQSREVEIRLGVVTDAAKMPRLLIEHKKVNVEFKEASDLMNKKNRSDVLSRLLAGRALSSYTEESFFKSSEKTPLGVGVSEEKNDISISVWVSVLSLFVFLLGFIGPLTHVGS